MNLQYMTKDLFTVPQGYYLAHCVSADFALGAGIAKLFDSVYNMRAKLKDRYDLIDRKEYVGHALLVDNVFNLVTKGKCWQKPTYDDLTDALLEMSEIMTQLDITKLAMPKIGCGLDKLEWDKVEQVITDIFDDMDVEILICEI